MKPDDLLHFYQEELLLLRRLGEKFATAHPKIAGHLRLTANAVEDPHVARLIESVALANARTRKKIADDFSEISDALLEMLHPHALSPFPATSICQFQINTQQLMTPKIIPAHSVLHSDNKQGQACQFKTCYPTQLIPLTPTAAKFTANINAPALPSQNYASVLCLSLTHTLPPNMPLLNIDWLRFFIHAPLHQAYALYNLLFQHTTAIAIAHSATDDHAIFLDPKNSLQPVGFKETEGILPYDKRIFLGYRLIKEFFACPEKFLFFDLLNLADALAEKLQKNTVNIYFYFKQHYEQLENNINANYFALSCTPIVNLFEQRAEPIMLSNTQTEYHLNPSIQIQPEAIEIYSVNQVTATTFAGDTIEFLPFYSLKNDDAYYYQTIRKPAWEAGYYPVAGSEIYLALSHPDLSQLPIDKWVMDIQLTCTNRDLPNQFILNKHSPGLRLQPSMPDFVDRIYCLTPINPCQHPTLTQTNHWPYCAHLALNHLFITQDSSENTDTLRRILQLYSSDQHADHNNTIASLLSVSSRTTFIRNPNGQRGNPFWQGCEIHLVVDESKFSHSNLFLLGCILDHFFSLYTHINSFTQLVIESSQNELFRFNPRTGNRALL